MSNPYSSQSISGYNASPPADDGSQTTANQITWAKHKTKLADPIKTLSEGINSAVSTAFGKIFLNSVSSKSTTYTVTADDQGKLINVTNTTTINLPASGSVGPNFVVTIRNNGSGTVTIDGNSSELINGSVTQTLAPSFSMILMSDGNGWYGLAALNEGLQTALTALNGLTSTAAELNRLDGTIPTVQENLQIFCGYSDAAGSAEIVPAGWSVATVALPPNVLRVTHNLGLSTPLTDLIITVSAVDSTADIVAKVYGTPGANSFDIVCWDSSAGTAALTAIYFTAIKRV